jgi:hypothetical protein
MTRRPTPDPEQPFEADLAAKLRAQFIESVDPALEQRHLVAMTKAFSEASATRPVVAAGRWRRSMTSGFLASTAAKVAAGLFAVAIATGTALAATGNLPGAQVADDDRDDDLSESGNEDEKADADVGDAATNAETETGAQTAADPTPTPVPAAAAQPAQELPPEPDNCDEADTLGEENDDENDPEDGLEGMDCDDDGAATAGTAGNSEEEQEEDID